jgi:hypothetical protein
MITDFADAVVGRHLDEFRARFRGGNFKVPAFNGEGDEEYGRNRYLEFPELGISIILDDANIAIAIQLYSAHTDPDEYREYEGILPGDLNFQSSRADARVFFGLPIRQSQGGPGTGLMGADGAPWDLFRTQSWDVNITYGRDLGSIWFMSVSLHNDAIAFPGGSNG